MPVLKLLHQIEHYLIVYNMIEYYLKSKGKRVRV